MDADTRDGPPIREFYGHWRGVKVNEWHLVVGNRRFPIRELRGLQVHRGAIPTKLSALLAVIGAQAAVVGIALGALSQIDTATAVLWAVGVAQALTTTVLVGLCTRHWQAPRELWALHDGRATMLFSCADHIEFEKVHRAVVRAMTLARDRKEKRG